MKTSLNSCYIAAVKHYDVIVLGGGAAGLMCAITAGNRGRRVLLLEGSNKIGKKILMSGGGRCNFTNLHCDSSHFISANPNFCISALSRYTQWDFIALVEKHDIQYHEKTLGQLFCNDSSKQIVKMLTDECATANADILCNCQIDSVTHEQRYVVRTNQGQFECDSLVVATGGLSIPKMGASDFGFRLAKQFDLNVLATRAGLVPLTFSGAMHELTQRLSGVSINAALTCRGTRFVESVLFTHRGLSGPAVLQVSSYWLPGDEIELDLMPGHNGQEILARAKRSHPNTLVRTILAEYLPNALVIQLQELWWHIDSETAIGGFSDARLNQLAIQLHTWVLKPAATEGYRTAEVTMGGIDTHELSSKTFECKRQAGLYCIGEVVDVTGHLGGFNFQWAWASGHAAGGVV